MDGMNANERPTLYVCEEEKKRRAFVRSFSHDRETEKRTTLTRPERSRGAGENKPGIEYSRMRRSKTLELDTLIPHSCQSITTSILLLHFCETNTTNDGTIDIATTYPAIETNDNSAR